MIHGDSSRPTAVITEGDRLIRELRSAEGVEWKPLDTRMPIATDCYLEDGSKGVLFQWHSLGTRAADASDYAQQARTTLQGRGYLASISVTRTEFGTVHEVNAASDLISEVAVAANESNTIISMTSICVPGSFKDYSH